MIRLSLSNKELLSEYRTTLSIAYSYTCGGCGSGGSAGVCQS